MINKVATAKEVPYGTYRGYLLLTEKDAVPLVKEGKNAWLFQTNSPKSLILLIEVTQNTDFDV